MRPSLAALTLLGVAAIASFATRAAAQSLAGWTTHNDVKGFSMSTPPGWDFAPDTRAGRIVVQGPKGEQVVARENAYSISVPQGWQTVGGLYHLSATDIRSGGIVVASPDGQIR